MISYVKSIKIDDDDDNDDEAPPLIGARMIRII